MFHGSHLFALSYFSSLRQKSRKSLTLYYEERLESPKSHTGGSLPNDVSFTPDSICTELKNLLVSKEHDGRIIFLITHFLSYLQTGGERPLFMDGLHFLKRGHYSTIFNILFSIICFQ